jgi:hypothetical protein
MVFLQSLSNENIFKKLFSLVCFPVRHLVSLARNVAQYMFSHILPSNPYRYHHLFFNTFGDFFNYVINYLFFDIEAWGLQHWKTGPVTVSSTGDFNIATLSSAEPLNLNGAPYFVFIYLISGMVMVLKNSMDLYSQKSI